MIKRRLLWQLYPSFLLITIIAMLLLTWYASRSLRSFYYGQVVEELTSCARLVEQQVLPALSNRSFEGIDPLCKRLGEAASTRITIILPTGTVIGDSHEDPASMDNHAGRPEVVEALREGMGLRRRFSSTLSMNMIYVAAAVEADGSKVAVVRTAKPITAIDLKLKELYVRVLWAFLIIAVGAAVVSLLVSRGISKPIEQMTKIAKSFSSGLLHLRVPIPESAELGELARALNEMARQMTERIETITKDKIQTQAILSSMIEGVLAVDYTGHVVSINKAAAELLGIEAADAPGRNVEEIIRNPEFLEFTKSALTQKQPTEADVSLTNNETRFLRLHGTALCDSKGQNTGAVIVLHDITRIRKLEDIRRDFVANVSHELKTPVTSIKGFAETLLDGAMNDPEQTRRFLRIITEHADRLNAIIEDLLSLSRLEDSAEEQKIVFEKHRIKPVLASAVELTKNKADEKHITIQLSCTDELEAKVNTVLLEQAVANLLDNGVKYSDDGETVQVTARQQTEKEITIAVRDNGCGIERKHLSRIFERFYVVDRGRSRRLGGTGLGLAIVKHICQAHGGFVTVESAPGAGSTFTIHLPIK
jgi:two-component system phosphate regulon sensor histidine kinase PhoR